MKNLPLKELLEKYNSGKCTEEERLWVENWYNQQDHSSPLPISASEFEKDLIEVYDQLPNEKEAPIRRKQWLATAAALIGGLLMVSVYIFLNENRDINAQDLSLSLAHDLEPGGNKATLRLADNSVIILDNMAVGEIYDHQSFRIRKLESGIIEYLVSPAETSSESVDHFNEISTPNGGQYQILLPDGSKVWLNASTTLKYPTQFSSHERVVELSGEAYFEVNKQDIPFYVQTKRQRIEVLGTHFNVNAYENEQDVKTTLIEGSVKVMSAVEQDNHAEVAGLILKPGEQSILNNEELKVKNVDVAQATAWKNGFFSFQGTDIEDVMRDFSRWYDVDVQFEGDISDTKLWGEIYRNVNASQALQILKYFDLKFKIVNEKGISRVEISKTNIN